MCLRTCIFSRVYNAIRGVAVRILREGGESRDTPLEVRRRGCACVCASSRPDGYGVRASIAMLLSLASPTP